MAKALSLFHDLWEFVTVTGDKKRSGFLSLI